MARPNAPKFFLPPPDSDIELKKQTVNHLIDMLDEEGIWNLAALFHARGLLQRNETGRDTGAQQGGTLSLSELVQPDFVPEMSMPGAGPYPTPYPTPCVEAAFAPCAPLQALAAQMFAQSTASSSSAYVSAEASASTADAKTTLILRNLPHQLEQTSGRDWLDKNGYAGLYDFFLWFPPKQEKKRVYAYGYALVNFRSKDVAERFKTSFDGTNPCEVEEDELESDQEPVLNITYAKVQGFVENYERFKAICNEPRTKCAPYFASDALRKNGLASSPSNKKLSSVAEDRSSARSSRNAHVDEEITTIVIRNLPTSVDTQEKARQWLHEFGYADSYDFLLYLPPKRRGTSSQKSYAYMFVNFLDSADATACTDCLHGLSTSESMPKLNVASSKVQGLDGCKGHFASLADSESCKPWIQEDGAVNTKKKSPGTPLCFQ
eukprot:TRINITY_DN13105_c0_g2_i1.p1 TRINITY_DN13105_c0_g2~~TRINITY_DN13105_c0_g2_i1.p1  ORF type:complete len:463 (-),score=85.27 TRINITY_DN13105_c0_g2_i1:215-1519(-)